MDVIKASELYSKRVAYFYAHEPSFGSDILYGNLIPAMAIAVVFAYCPIVL